MANPQQGGEVATTRQAHPLVVLDHELSVRTDQFKKALPGHISVEKFQRTVLTAVQNDPDLLNADRQSLMTACMKAATDGLLPDKREAALVIFTTRQKDKAGNWSSRKLVQYMPMVYGLRKKILQSGEIKDIFAGVVYADELEAGRFVYEEGAERTLRHKPLFALNYDPKDEDIVIAYSIATLTDGSQSYEVMRRSEINKVREKSQTGALFNKDGTPRQPAGPWVEWFSEQCRKTVIRRHSKALPMSGDLLAEIESMSGEDATHSTLDVLAAAPGSKPLAIEDGNSREAVFDLAPGETVDGDGVVTDTTDKPEATEKPRGRKPKREPEPAEAVEAEPEQAAAGSLDDAKAAVTGAELVGDVNTRVMEWLPKLSEDDGDELKSFAIERIEAMKRPKAG